MNKVKAPTNFDVIESLNFIWDKLKKFIPNDPHSPIFDEEEWDDICTAMSWIEDECNVERIEGILEYKMENK
tara:strand:+ start:113 stop:328 length:216 start_codon:yes stop_codon:yes gene_type:complete